MPGSEQPLGESARTGPRPVKAEANFPKLKELFDRRWPDLAAAVGKANLRDVTERIEEAFGDETISSRLRSYRYGARRPRPNEIEIVAGWFFNSKWKKDARQHAQFSRELADAAQYGREGLLPTSAYYSLTDLRAGRKLRVGAIQYSHFCNPGTLTSANTGFVDSLFERFLRFSSLMIENDQVMPVDLADAIEQLATAKLHVVLGILATADRLLDLEFFSFPIRIGLNAVIRKADIAHEERVREVLSKRSVDAKETGNIVPVILEMEIGGIYVKKGLDWKSDRIQQVDKLDPAQYWQAMQRLQAEDPLLVGVAVADEISCLDIEHYINRIGGSAKLVFPLSGARDRGSLRLPQYMLAFATHVDARDLKQHLRHAFELYVDADDEEVVYEYLRLAGQLAESARRKGRQSQEAIRWALHQLRLMRNDYFPANCIFPDTLRQEAVEKMHELVRDHQKESDTQSSASADPLLPSWMLDVLSEKECRLLPPPLEEILTHVLPKP